MIMVWNVAFSDNWDAALPSSGDSETRQIVTSRASVVNSQNPFTTKTFASDTPNQPVGSLFYLPKIGHFKRRRGLKINKLRSCNGVVAILQMLNIASNGLKWNLAYVFIFYYYLMYYLRNSVLHGTWFISWRPKTMCLMMSLNNGHVTKCYVVEIIKVIITKRQNDKLKLL